MNLLLLNYMCIAQNIYVGTGVFIKQGSKVNISNSLYGNSGANIDNNGNINIGAGFYNNQSESLIVSTENTGEFSFNGNSGSQEIGGSYKTEFYNLRINNTADGVLLNQNADVINNLYMSNGALFLENSILDLGDLGQIVGESEINRIRVSDITSNTGQIRVSRVIDNTTINPGNIGLEIITSKNMGYTTISRTHKEQQGTGSFSGNFSVCRTFEISPTNEVDSEIRFFYFEIELTEGTSIHLEDELIMYHDVEYWEPLATTIFLTENEAIANTSRYSKFTLGSESIPLPVELVSISANWLDQDNSSAIIKWVTASETNLEYFAVEYSDKPDNGEKSWHCLGTLLPIGSNNEDRDYFVFDSSPNLHSIRYYRLKSVEFDNQFELSKIVCLIPTISSNDKDILLYPNPTNGNVYIQMSENYNELLVSIYNSSGQLISEKEVIDYQKGGVISCDVHAGTSGVCLMIIKCGGEVVKTERIIIQK